MHTAQLMPLPLTVSCSSKIQIGFTFLVPAHPGSPGQRAIKRVCVCVCVFHYILCNSDFDFTLFYNLSLCFIPLEMHVHLIYAVKICLLTCRQASTCLCRMAAGDTLVESRWVWSVLLARGTTRSRWPSGSPVQHWLPVTRSSSSHLH